MTTASQPPHVSSDSPYSEVHRARLEILQIYGLTETCGPACVIGPDDATTHVGSTAKASSTPTSDSSTSTATTSRRQPRQVLADSSWPATGTDPLTSPSAMPDSSSSATASKT